MIGRRVLIGGADLTVECVGSGRSLDDALRLTAPGGRVILLGLAAVPSGVDWTPIWWKELRVTGSYVYGIEQWQGRTAKIGVQKMESTRLNSSHVAISYA